MDCSLSSLIEASKCYRCIPGPVMQASAISLLCQWANNLTPTPPPCVISWVPATAVATWTDSGGVHVGNLAAFLATPTHPSTTELNLTSTGITECNCIQYLSLLEMFRAQGNNLTTLDFHGMVNLDGIVVDLNPNLDIPPANLVGCPLGDVFSAGTCNLTNIDFSGNTTLGSNSPISGVDISGNVNIISPIDFSGCSGMANLTAVGVSGPAPITLNASGCTGLLALGCDGGGLGEINLSGDSSLLTVDCNSNASLTTLTLTGCTALVTLNCSNCNLPSLTLDGFTNLATPTVSNNPNMTSFSAVGCSSFVFNLDLTTNMGSLDSIDISGCSSLLSIMCNDNVLTSLKVTGCGGLEELWCYNNSSLTAIVGDSDLGSILLFHAYNCNLSACSVVSAQVSEIRLNGNTNLSSLTVNPACTQFAVLDFNGCALTTTAGIGVNDLMVNVEANSLANSGTIDITGCASPDAGPPDGATAKGNLIANLWTIIP